MAYHIAGGHLGQDVNFAYDWAPMDGVWGEISPIDLTPDGGTVIVKNRLQVGRPVEAHNVPTKVLREGPGLEQLPLLDVNRIGNALLVNETFKQIVEELEPNVHQFFPMDYYIKDHDPESYDPGYGIYRDGGCPKRDVKIGSGYMFIICNRLDTLHPDPTLCYPRDARGVYTGHDGMPDRRLCFSTERIGQHHAWIDRFVSQGRYVSNELVERLRSAELTGMYLLEKHEA